MPTVPFPTWVLTDVRAALATAATRPPLGSPTRLAGTRSVSTDPRLSNALGDYATGHAQVRGRIAAYLSGDAWQRGSGWVGPKPPDSSALANDTAARQALEEGFLSRNVLAEILERHRDGVLGKEPAWGAARADETGDTPADAKPDATLEALVAAWVGWWDRERVAEKLEAAGGSVLWNERQPLRLYFRPDPGIQPDSANVRELRAAPRPGESDLAAALRLVGLDVPVVGQAGVFLDPNTEQRAAIYQREIAPATPGASVGAAAAGRVEYEVAYVDFTSDARETVLLVFQDGDDRRATDAPAAGGRPALGPTGAYRVRLGERLPVYDLERPALLSDDLADLQAAYNLCLTALARREVSGAWLEEYLINAQVPGRLEEVRDDNGRVIQRKFTPDPIERGPGVRQHVTGIPQTDANGNTTLTSPTVVHRQPAANDPTTLHAVYEAMLERVSQRHVLASLSASSSGDAQQQWRAEFLRSLLKTANTMNPAIRWLLETATAMAEAVLGTPGAYTDKYRATAQCRLDAGPVPALEQTANLQAVKDGQLSLGTALARNGVDDPDAEIAAMRTSPEGRLKRVTDILTALALAATAGIATENVIELMGLTEDEHRELTKVVNPAPVPGDQNPNPPDPNAPPPANPPFGNAAPANQPPAPAPAAAANA